MATIKDVAHRASVAPMTVSRVLNNPDSVSPETRERVEDAIAELRYVPNRVGQGLRNKNTMVIGLVVSDISNPFAIEQIRGVSEAGRRHDYTVLFGHTEASDEEERRQLRMLLERRVDGIILSPVHNGADAVNFVQEQGCPIVVLDYPMPDNDVDVVRCDTRVAARQQTEYLLGLGHTRMAMISGSQGIITARERADGFLDAMQAAGVGAPVRFGSFSPESGYEIAHELLGSTDPPSAIVTANNFIALGVAKAAAELGVSIPGALSIVTFDNAQSELVLDPFFTGIVQPVREMANRATELLLDRIQGRYDGPGRTELLEPAFEIHNSTSPPSTRA